VKGLLGDGAHRAQCGECTRPHWRGVLPKRDDAASAQITPRGNLVGLAATAYVLLGCSGRMTRYLDRTQVLGDDTSFPIPVTGSTDRPTGAAALSNARPM
jgi:hypothetical protein